MSSFSSDSDDPTDSESDIPFDEAYDRKDPNYRVNLMILQKLEEVTEGIRLYYQLNLMVPPPLPWLQLRSSKVDSCVEFVIKSISGTRNISLPKSLISRKSSIGRQIGVEDTVF